MAGAVRFHLIDGDVSFSARRKKYQIKSNHYFARVNQGRV
jgi:hypothetical protein